MQYVKPGEKYPLLFKPKSTMKDTETKLEFLRHN